MGFNTASGKCCCNIILQAIMVAINSVSIPQAVSAVATENTKGKVLVKDAGVSIPQAVSAVATPALKLLIINIS